MSLRAVIVGLVLVVALSILVSYADLGVSIGWIGGAHLPAASMGFFVILVLLVNTSLKKIAPRVRLKSAELLIIYCMMLPGALIPSFGLTSQLIPCLAGVNYFATPENKWRALFYRYIPNWLVPFDPTKGERQRVIVDFYEGLHYGEPIPWKEWAMPLVSWTIFFFAFFGLLLCLSVIIRKQWIDNEKLSFPLVQLPVEMAREEEVSRGAVNPLFRNKLMWFGFAIPFIIHGVNGLHGFFPAFPEVPVQIWVNQYFPRRPWSDMGPTCVFLSFSVTGFSYLVPSDLTFSFWFFFIFFRLQAVVASAFGMTLDNMPLFPAHLFVAHQAMGASVVFAVYMLWLSKGHLKSVFRKAFLNEKSVDDSSEPLSYRGAVYGLIASFMVLTLWCTLAGLNFLIAFLILGLLVLFLVLVLTRSVSAAGLLMIQGLFRPTDLIALVTSRGWLGEKNLTILAFLDCIFIRDLRGVLLPTFLDSFKISEAGKIDKRGMMAALVMAIIVATLTSYGFALWLIYRQGGVTLSGWFMMSNPQISWLDTASILQFSPPFDWRRPFWFTLGAIFTLFLFLMRSRFAWFPFHPLGYAMGASWPLILFWFPFLIGWLLKIIILRYGGGRSFMKARPFFLGLILGEFVAAILWSSISLFTRMRGPIIPVC